MIDWRLCVAPFALVAFCIPSCRTKRPCYEYEYAEMPKYRSIEAFAVCFDINISDERL